MDVREFSKALGEIDEGYCAQALAYKPRRHRRPLWAAAACLAAIPPLPLLPPVRWIGCLASVCAVRRMGCGM